MPELFDRIIAYQPEEIRARMAFLFSIGFLGLLSWYLWRREQHEFSRYFWPILVYRLGAGLLLGLLYTAYYGDGDTLSFYRDATRLSALARNDPGAYIEFLFRGGIESPIWPELTDHQHRSLFMVKWVSIVTVISGDNYWITLVYFSFFSFAGAWYLAKVISGRWKGAATAALFAFLLYPSVAFWSSGIMKEALSLPCLFFMTGVFITYWYSGKLTWTDFILFLFAAWISWRLKYYYNGVFFAVAVTSLIVRYTARATRISRPVVQLLVWTVVFAALATGVTLLHPNFHPDVLPGVVADNYEAYAKLTDEGGMIHYPGLDPTFASMIRYAPKAFFSGLFRPFLWEADSWIMLLGAIENAVLLLFFLVALTNYKRRVPCGEPVVAIAVITFIVILGVLLPLSTPNYGTLSRHRVGYLPFFVFLIIYGNPLFGKVVQLKERLYSRLAGKP